MEKKNIPEELKKVWQKVKQMKYIPVIILLGIVLILQSGEKQESNTVKESTKGSSFSLETEENRIADALSRIDGAGKVDVVLTVRSTGKVIIAEDMESYVVDENGETRQEESLTAVIVSGESRAEAPVELQEVFPEYLGALVIAEGAENAEIRLRLTNAVADLTGLSTDKISVLKMKSS